MSVIQTITLTDDYSVTLDMLAGANFCKKRNATLYVMNEGVHTFYFTRHCLRMNVDLGGGLTGIITFKLNGIYETDFAFYQYAIGATTNRTIFVNYDYNNDEVRVYGADTDTGDFYLIGTSNYNASPSQDTDRDWHLPAANYVNARFRTFASTDGSNSYPACDEMSGTIQNFFVYADANLPSPIISARPEVKRQYDYIPGYSSNGYNGNVAGLQNIFELEAMCMQPPWFGGSWAASGMKPIGSAFDTARIVGSKTGYDGTGTFPPQATINDVIAFSELLVARGYTFRVIFSMQNFYQYRNLVTSYSRQLMSHVLANPPQTKVEISAAIAQIDAAGGFTPNVLSGSAYTDPDSIVDNNRDIYEVYGNAVLANLGNIPLDFFEDGEGDTAPPSYPGTPQPARSKSSGSKWVRFLSKIKALFSNMVTYVYDRYDHRYIDNDGVRKPWVTDVNTNNLTTNSIYSRTPYEWWPTNGERRGLLFDLQVRYWDRQMTPPQYKKHTVIGFGWDPLPENNLSPAQSYLQAKLLIGLGVDSTRWGFFYEGAQQDGILHFHQAIVISDCMAVSSFDQDIMTNGTLLDGDLYLDETVESIPNKLHWTGTPLVPFLAWKLGTRYLFIYGYERLSNFQNSRDEEYAFTITVDGHALTFDGTAGNLPKAREQGNWVVWDSTNPTTYTFRDAYHQNTHPVYWGTSDVIAPVISDAAGSADVILECDNTTGLADALAFRPTVTDNVDPKPVETIDVVTSGPGPCNYTITRTFTYTDFSGNVSEPFVQTIQILPEPIVPPNPTMNMGIEITDVQDFSCCIGNIGVKLRNAEAAGNSANIIKFRNQILVMETIVEALETYDEDIDTNLLSALEIQRLKEIGHQICGCCCNEVDPNLKRSTLPTIPPNAPSCGLNDLQGALYSCSTPHVLIIDRTGSLDFKNYNYLYETSEDGTNYSFLDEGVGMYRKEFNFTGDILYLRITVTCPNSSDSLQIVMDKSNDWVVSSFAFNNYMQYRVNGGPRQTIVSGEAWAAEGDSVEVFNANTTDIEATIVSQFYGTLGTDSHTFTFASVPYADPAHPNYWDLLNISLVDKLYLPDNCSADQSTKIAFVPKPVISGTDYSCSNAARTLTAYYGENLTTDYETYQWYKNGVAIPGETSKQFTNLTESGSYTCVATKKGVTVTSLAHVVSMGNIPQPVMTIEPISDDYVVSNGGNKCVLASNSLGANMIVVDSGFYSGGYPVGTTFDFYGLGDVLYQTGTSNTFFNQNNSDNFYCKVTLPGSVGGCYANSNTVVVDFTIPYAQIYPNSDTIISVKRFPCTGLTPAYPAGDDPYLWSWGNIDDCVTEMIGCACSGDSRWSFDQTAASDPLGSHRIIPYTLNSSVAGQVTIHCDFLIDTSIPFDMSKNIRWYKLYDVATDSTVNTLVQTGGLDLVVTEAGIYGAYSESVKYSDLTVLFGNILFFVKSIP